MTTSSSTPITEREDVVQLLDRVPLTPIEKQGPQKICCVTGATSMVGSHVVRRLLRIGHTVHAPVFFICARHVCLILSVRYFLAAII